MSNEGDLSHRQEREQKKEEHAHPTRGKYLSSKHLTWVMVLGVIVTGAAAIIWTLPSASVAWPRLSDQGGDLSDYRAAPSAFGSNRLTNAVPQMILQVGLS